MSQTEARLKEAMFFFKQMLKNPSNPEFDYFLNAFLTSSRSITWVMRNEFGKVPGWEEWFQAQRVSQEEQELLSLMTSRRNKSQKISPIASKPYFSATIPAENVDDALIERLQSLVGKPGTLSISIDDDGKPMMLKAEMTVDGIEDIPIILEGVVSEFDRTIDNEIASAPVREQCGKYLLIVKNLVDECTKKFPFSTESE